MAVSGISTNTSDSARSPDLAGLVGQLATARVLCIGDVMLDRFVRGSVDRVSPEAPVPVLRIVSESAMLGGAGNVVRNLTALGVQVWFVSVVGNDDAGRELTRLVGREAGVEAHLLVDQDRETTVKQRYLAGGQQLLRADRETVAPIPKDIEDQLLEIATDALREASILVLSDYGKGVLSDQGTRRLIEAARAQGRPVIVDPKGRDFARYKGATMLTPNRRELEEATGLPADEDDRVVMAAQRLLALCEITSVLVTRSERGMSLIRQHAEGEKAAMHLPTEAREVFDVSGAGDTVVSVLSAGLAAGLSDGDSARLANSAAGIVVGKVGTAVVEANDLASALREASDRETLTKVVSLDQALEQVDRWRRKNLKIGFTNGVFDLLHPGHVSLLGQARGGCDRLVVGLNTDASVKRLKGPERPVQDERARAQVLAALASVDLVVLFGADTPIDLIEALRPELLVKGADYRIEEVVGAPLVQGYGGRVMLANLTEGQSTTSMIARMGTP